MAGWQQAVGGAALYTVIDGVPTLIVDGDTGVPVTGEDGGWTAFQTVKTASQAGWVQTSLWSATANAQILITGSATFDQAVAQWESLASERLNASAAFLQAPAAFEAVSSESFPATATFEQTQLWEAAGLSAEDVFAEGTFEQSATWLGASSQIIFGTAGFEQGQAWDAAGSSIEAVAGNATYVQGAGEWGAVGLALTLSPHPQPRQRRYRPQVFGYASFGQAPAEWHAEMNVTRPVDEAVELVLAGVI